MIYVIREHDPSGADIEKYSALSILKNTLLHNWRERRGKWRKISGRRRAILLSARRAFSGFSAPSWTLSCAALVSGACCFCGAQYPNCIRATAVDGIGLDYDVEICPDATWGISREVIDANIYDICAIWG